MDPYAQINHLWQQNRKITQENQTLKQSLEELIAVNTELTQSIQQYSNNNGLQAINQQLQTENKNLKNQLNNTIRQLQQVQTRNNRPQSSRENQEMANVIQELIQSSKTAQIAYEEEIQKLSEELESQKNYWEGLVKDLENKYNSMIQEYQKRISDLKSNNQLLNQNIEMKMLKQSQNIHNEERKNLKVSTTIEDLRNVLEKQIEEKEKVIRVYENLIHKLKQKLKEKY